MTWKLRQSLGLCEHGRCQSPRVEHTDYCQRHLEDKKQRNKKYMRIRRAMRRVQLGLGL